MGAEVSILIPVYNLSGYIERCVRSVIAAIEFYCKSGCCKQGSNNAFAEIICVDDGSSDGSGELLDHLADEYSSHLGVALIAIHQKNSGVSRARNVALKRARGRYIVFIDGDDYIEKSFFLKCVSDMDHDCMLDVWIGQRRIADNEFNLMDADSQPRQIPAMETKSPVKDFSRIEGRNYLYCVWGKVFRKEIFDRTGLLFDPRLDIGEDSLLMGELFANARAVKVHCEREKSLVRRSWAELVPQYIMAIRILESYAIANQLDSVLSQLIGQWALGRFKVMFNKGYSYEWMSAYITALCKEKDFKQIVLCNIARRTRFPYCVIAGIMKILPSVFVEKILKISVKCACLGRGVGI